MDLELLEKIVDLGRQLAETRRLKPLLDSAVNMALDFTGGEYGYLVLINRQGDLEFRVGCDKHGNPLAEPEEQISYTILEQVVSSGKAKIFDDAFETFASTSVLELKLRSVVCVPLISRGEILGAIYVENRSVVDLFEEADLQLLEYFAALAAVAIENAMLNDDLETQVALRTAQLEEQNQELDAYAHTVAHDLKNPLSALAGYCKMLTDELDDPENEFLKQCVDGISNNSYRMDRIIDELLLLSKIRKEQVEVQPLDMDQLVRDVMESLSLTIKRYDGHISLPQKWDVALGYAPWIEEVWVNYITNGLKFGGQPPHLELGSINQGDGMVRFWVRDHGDGLSQEDQDRLFTEFTQLNGIRFSGHGLGLSIVKRIISKLGGAVGVESEGLAGKGTVFYFTLPF